MSTAAMFSIASTSWRSWLCQITAPGARPLTKASPCPASASWNAATSSSLLGIVLPRCCSANVETRGGGRHLVQELATPAGVGSTCHVAEVLHEDEAVDAEIFVPSDGVGIDGARQGRDGDFERAEVGGPVDLVGEARELVDRGLRRLEVLEEPVPTLAPFDGSAVGGGHEPAPEDRRSTRLHRLRAALDATERREFAVQLGLVVVPERAQRVDPLVGDPAAAVE